MGTTESFMPGLGHSKIHCEPGESPMSDEKDENTEAVQPTEAQEEELTALLNEIRHQAFGIALRITNNPADAEDVLQDSLLKAYQNLPQFRGESSLSTWLGSIVTNQAITTLRQRFSRNEVSLDRTARTTEERKTAPIVVDPGDSPETGAMKAEFRAVFARTIEELDEKLRVIFVLREMGDFSMEELAQVLELSVPAAKSRLFEARKKLARRIRRRVGKT
jgi:RNA polymerase sigma-70 factor (ECF subfamily)